MTDTVRYAIGFGPLGELAAPRCSCARDVEAIFDLSARERDPRAAGRRGERRRRCSDGSGARARGEAVEDEVRARAGRPGARAT